MTRTRTYTYQGIRIVSFSEKFSYVLNNDPLFISRDNTKMLQLIFKNFLENFVSDCYSLAVIIIITFTFLMIKLDLVWISFKVTTLKRKNIFLPKIAIECDTVDLLVTGSFLLVTNF